MKYESDCRAHLPLADVSYSRGIRDEIEGVAARVMSFPVKSINLSPLSGQGNMLWIRWCCCKDVKWYLVPETSSGALSLSGTPRKKQLHTYADKFH